MRAGIYPPRLHLGSALKPHLRHNHARGNISKQGPKSASDQDQVKILHHNYVCPAHNIVPIPPQLGPCLAYTTPECTQLCTSGPLPSKSSCEPTAPYILPHSKIGDVLDADTLAASLLDRSTDALTALCSHTLLRYTSFCYSEHTSVLSAI